MIKSANKIMVISVIFISLFNFNTKAQDTNQTISEIEEILVTAQRRAENIDDVPIAITVADKEALRNAGISAEIYPDESKLKKQMEYANKIKSPAVILFGENEIKMGKPTLRNLNTGKEQSIEVEKLANEIKKII